MGSSKISQGTNGRQVCASAIRADIQVKNKVKRYLIKKKGARALSMCEVSSRVPLLAVGRLAPSGLSW
ncbi:hypothetical protein AUK22_04180 [bacterium CG2_30_54_10]|nr:MAG: hypothetical protein AUK22_04180 [bacterium CG2_30_54_10]